MMWLKLGSFSPMEMFYSNDVMNLCFQIPYLKFYLPIFQEKQNPGQLMK